MRREKNNKLYVHDLLTFAIAAKQTNPILTLSNKNDIIIKWGYVLKGGGSAFGGELKIMNSNYNPEDYKFESLGEFKFSISTGWNLGLEWNGVDYGIEGHNNSFDIWIYDKGDIANGLTLDELLEYALDGTKIRDLILSAKIIERHI